MWKPATGLEVVCDKHFKPEDFKEPIKSLAAVGGRARRLLKQGAVPSKFDHLRQDNGHAAASAEKRAQRLEKRRQIEQDNAPEVAAVINCYCLNS
jgi:hypothetical protein